MLRGLNDLSLGLGLMRAPGALQFTLHFLSCVLSITYISTHTITEVRHLHFTERWMKEHNMGIDFEKLDQFADKVLEKYKNVMGYPVNQNTSLDEFYKWYVEKKLYCVSMNNVGDPCRRERDSNYSINTHEFEREVVDYFAKLYAFKND